MRKLLTGFLLVLSLTLTGCFGGEATSVEEAPDLSTDTFEVFETERYRIFFPRGWKQRTDFTSDVAQSTQVAFISNIKEVFFTPTVTVAAQSVSGTVAAEDFAKSVIEQNEKGLLNYQEVERRSVQISEEAQTILVQFRGKRQPEGNIVEYFQTYYTKGGLGFVITGAHDPNGDAVLADRLIETVASFRLK